MLAWQPSLWGDREREVDPTFSGVERTWLDRDSWVEHGQGWLRGSDGAFEELLAHTDWGQRRRWMYERHVDEPRLTAWRSLDGPDAEIAGWLEDARRRLSDRYGVDFDSMGLNLYRDGSDSVAWHRDRIPADIAVPVVALLSVGEPRTFLLRPHGGGRSRTFMLGHGDLLVTGGQTQRRFEHCVPKRKMAGPRLSIAFRHGVG